MQVYNGLTGYNFYYFCQVGLFFTASSDHCSECAAALAEYSTAASLFGEQYNISDSDTSAHQLIFFFVISAVDSPEIFQTLGINFAPQLFLISPKTDSDPKQPLSDFMVNIFEEPDLVQAIAVKGGVEV